MIGTIKTIAIVMMIGGVGLSSIFAASKQNGVKYGKT